MDTIEIENTLKSIVKRTVGKSNDNSAINRYEDIIYFMCDSMREAGHNPNKLIRQYDNIYVSGDIEAKKRKRKRELKYDMRENKREGTREHEKKKNKKNGKRVTSSRATKKKGSGSDSDDENSEDSTSKRQKVYDYSSLYANRPFKKIRIDAIAEYGTDVKNIILEIVFSYLDNLHQRVEATSKGKFTHPLMVNKYIYSRRNHLINTIQLSSEEDVEYMIGEKSFIREGAPSLTCINLRDDKEARPYDHDYKGNMLKIFYREVVLNEKISSKITRLEIMTNFYALGWYVKRLGKYPDHRVPIRWIKMMHNLEHLTIYNPYMSNDVYIGKNLKSLELGKIKEPLNFICDKKSPPTVGTLVFSNTDFYFVNSLIKFLRMISTVPKRTKKNDDGIYNLPCVANVIEFRESKMNMQCYEKLRKFPLRNLRGPPPRLIFTDLFIK